MITEGIIIALITVFGGALVKIIYDVSESRKENAQLQSILEAQAARVRRRNKITDQFNLARDTRAAVFDEYDMAIKHLAMDHARSYISGNDKMKLQMQLDRAEKARVAFKQVNSEYYDTLRKINKQLLDLDKDE